MAEMRERIDRLRIDVKALAVSAGLNRHTVDKVLAGGVDPRVSTVEALDAALVAEERALFDWLVSLHPDWPGAGHAFPALAAAPGSQGAAAGGARTSAPPP